MIMSMELNPEVARYVVRFHWHLMTDEEHRAQRHLASTIKATGRSDVAAQEDARKSLGALDLAIRAEIGREHHAASPSRSLSNDPNVLRLATDGFEAFQLRTAARVLQERTEEVELNLGPRCNRLARTPTAKQCRYCGYDWHAA
jgi:hypothetical protein